MIVRSQVASAGDLLTAPNKASICRRIRAGSAQMLELRWLVICHPRLKHETGMAILKLDRRSMKDGEGIEG